MWIAVANVLVVLGLAYAALGLVFAVPFVLRGAARIDPDAERGTWGFKVLILPGVAAFWPLLLARWVRSAPPPEERSSHRDAARRGA